jgi:dTDP-4-dehydrorhamnose reductase
MSPLKVVITGAQGQLGIELVSLFKGEKSIEVIGLGRKDLDVTDYNQVLKKIDELMPDIVIHTAAYTDVDFAEEEPDTAFLVNGIGTKNLVMAVSKVGSKFVYLSTDYVFNGKCNKPIDEFETPHPLGVYGQTKLVGENYVKEYLSKFYIVRTSWVFGKHGKNFVKTMLKLSKEKNQIRVVDDQIGSPTYTLDLAQCILRLIFTESYGIYHVTNTGYCSWYEFAKAIFEEVNIAVDLVPCKTTEFQRKAPRPKYSVLKDTQLSVHGLPTMRNWRVALTEFIEETYFNNNHENSKDMFLHVENLSRAGEFNGFK